MQPSPSSSRIECPGSRAYVARDERADMTRHAEVVERGGQFNNPQRARCPSCKRVYSVVGPATYHHIRKHYVSGGAS